MALKPVASVAAAGDGFFTLGQIADLSGGDAATRTRMAAVSVGRVPLAGDTRRLTWGDVALKLRQAGFRPDKDALREGAAQVTVTVQNPPAAPPLLGAGGAVLIHRGDAVMILVQSGALTITARGVAREAGAAGSAIRVHREGVMADLSATIVDAQTVQLEF